MSRATPTPTIPAPVAQAQRTVERVAFATRVRRNGEPMDERSGFSESPAQMYLCVQVRDIELGTRFRAYWFSEGQIIGQSDALATREDDVVWVALGYRPIAALDPTRQHSVELQIDTQTIDRYYFRVGAGEAADVIAEAAFTTGFNEAGKPVDTRDTFAEDEAELRLLARISRQVDPTAMLFTSVWYRGDTTIAWISPETLPNDATPGDDSEQAEGTPATAIRPSTVLAFTYQPNSPLPRGSYRVALLLNGTEIRSIPFTVGDAAAPTEDAPGDDPADDSSPDQEAEAAIVEQLVITAAVDPDTGEPAAVNIWVWEDGVREEQELYATFSVTDLAADDEVIIAIERDGDIVDTLRVEHQGLQRGWVATAFEIDTPRVAGTMARYRVVIEINGRAKAERAFEVWAVNR
jgi:hypothetical protein